MLVETQLSPIPEADHTMQFLALCIYAALQLCHYLYLSTAKVSESRYPLRIHLNIPNYGNGWRRFLV